jgi:hypothetical protein
MLALVALTLTHRSGEMNEYSAEEDVDRLLAELDQPADAEHPDVSITLDSGLTLSAYQSGLVVLEDVEADEVAPMYRRGVNRDDARRMFRLFAHGDVAAVRALEWHPGYGT